MTRYIGIAVGFWSHLIRPPAYIEPGSPVFAVVTSWLSAVHLPVFPSDPRITPCTASVRQTAWLDFPHYISFCPIDQLYHLQ